MSESALAIERISKRFGRRDALRGVSLDVAAAALVVLLGPAGAGKTTTLRIAAGLERPDHGTVSIAGRDVTDAPPNQRGVAMIFDNLALYPNKTGFENIASPLRIARCPALEITTRVHAIATTLRIPHVLNRLPRTMSGGERQRVALGRALVREPSVFLLDEPLSSLDAMLRLELRAELRRLQRERGYSFLLATPDFAEALAIADKVVLLRDGVVRQVAAPQELYDAPVDRETARFVGAPEINVLPADYDPDEGGRLRLAGAVLPAPRSLRSTFNGAATRFDAGLRPEHLAIVAPEVGALGAEVVDLEPLGLKSTVMAKAGDALIRVVMPAAESARLAPGVRIGIALRLERLLVFEREGGQRLG